MPSIAVLCGSLMSCVVAMFFRYFLNDFEMVPVALIIPGILLFFIFYISFIYIVCPLYFKIFPASS
jgi:hypothetical protein